MKATRHFALWPLLAATFMSNPEQPSLSPPMAQAASRLVCSSVNFDYSYCRADTRGGVRLRQQLSSARCIEGRSWGSDPRGIWVDHGCSAEFSVGSSGSDAGKVIGAVVVGGIVGALLSSGSDGDRRNTTRDTSRRYRHDYRDDDVSPPAYDRYGDANYDRRGRYRGCHGLGCTVDNPDASRPDHSQDVDTTPQFDKDGNPNFDTDGNYVGAHGLGATVDNPDTDNSN